MTPTIAALFLELRDTRRDKRPLPSLAESVKNWRSYLRFKD